MNELQCTAHPDVEHALSTKLAAIALVRATMQGDVDRIAEIPTRRGCSLCFQAVLANMVAWLLQVATEDAAAAAEVLDELAAAVLADAGGDDTLERLEQAFADSPPA